MKIGSFPPGHGIEPEDASIATSSTLQLPTVVIQGVSQREQSTRYCQHVLVETTPPTKAERSDHLEQQ